MDAAGKEIGKFPSLKLRKMGYRSMKIDKWFRTDHDNTFGVTTRLV